jgi:hypothetical protein
MRNGLEDLKKQYNQICLCRQIDWADNFCIITNLSVWITKI